MSDAYMHQVEKLLRGIVQWWHNGMRVVLSVSWIQFVWPLLSLQSDLAKSIIFKKALLVVYELLLPFFPESSWFAIDQLFSYAVGLEWKCFDHRMSEYVLKGTFTSAPGLHYLPTSYSKDAASAACCQAYLLHASLSLRTLSLWASVTCLHTSINDWFLLTVKLHGTMYRIFLKGL